MTADHQHKFNATIVPGYGRCSCGAWGHFNKPEKAWAEVTHPATAKGLNTKLRNLQDPNFSHPRWPKADQREIEEEDRQGDLVSIYGDPSRMKY